MPDEEVLAFASAAIRSIWTLELLLLMRREGGRSWTRDELVRELRASNNVVQAGLTGLAGAGLIAVEPDNRVRFQPVTEHLASLVDALQALYLARPVALIQAIATPSDEKLRIFADSFKLKE